MPKHTHHSRFHDVEDIDNFLYDQIQFRQANMQRMPENSAFWAVKAQLLAELDLQKLALAVSDDSFSSSEPQDSIQ